MSLRLSSPPASAHQKAALLGAIADQAGEGRTPGLVGAMTASQSTAGPAAGTSLGKKEGPALFSAQLLRVRRTSPA